MCQHRFSVFCIIPAFRIGFYQQFRHVWLKTRAHTIKLPTFNPILRRVYRLEVDQTIRKVILRAARVSIILQRMKGARNYLTNNAL